MFIRNVFVLLFLCCSSAWSYKILMICAPPTRSHYNLCSAVTNILTERDHEVTFITAFSANKPTKYREVLVDLSKMIDDMPSTFKMANMSISERIYFMKIIPTTLSNAIFHNPNVEKILNDKNEKFDLVIIEYLMNQHLLGLSVKYDCPAMFLTSVTMFPWIATSTGNPLAIATLPNPMSYLPLSMNLWQRIVNLFYQVMMDFLEIFFTTPLVKILYEKDFPEESKIVPFSELHHRIAGVLSNSHHSILSARPTLPNVAEVAGYHIEDPAPLPENLQKIMDSAKDGIIYFSLGSIVKTKEMTPEFKQSIIKSLSKFKQTILWKLDEDIDDLPKNIIIQKWMPQTSILAHPNIKLFITHGGLLSLTEATHFGVPVLIIPVFGDQHHNARVFSDRGQGITLDFNHINEETLTTSVEEMINNQKYADITKKVSAIFHDRPVKPRDLVAYQVEHVIRTNGGSHMSPPYLPRYSHLLLDVFAIILTPIIAIALLLKCVCKKICKKLCSKLCNSQKKIKTN